MGKNRHRYLPVLQAFVTRDPAPSITDLSVEFNISRRQLGRVAGSEDWTKQRREYVSEVSRRTLELAKKEAIAHREKVIRELRTAQERVIKRIIGGETKENAATFDKLVRLEAFLLGEEDSRPGNSWALTYEEFLMRAREAHAKGDPKLMDRSQ